MPDQNEEYRQNHPYRALGMGYWLPWSLAMLALLAAFLAMVFFLQGVPQPWRIILHGLGVILFTLAIIGLNRVTCRALLRRGLGDPMRPAMRRYQARVLTPMMIYVVVLLGVTYFWKTTHPTSVINLIAALLPSVPVLFCMRALYRWLCEETDEYLRLKMLEAWAIATGVTLAVAMVVGFLDTFKAIPHIPLWTVLPFWAICMGVAQTRTGQRCV